MANGVLGAAHDLGIKRKPMNAGSLKVWAQRLTGLKDFGNPFFEAPLALLIEDINEDTDLHDAGRFFHRVFLTGFLQNRLRLVEAWKRNPHALQQEVKPPLVILGLPRTATTRLFNILAGAPDFRTMTFWEAASPARWRSERWLPFNPRRVTSAMTLGATDFLAPNFKSIHELMLEGPEECIHLFGNSFTSWIFPVEYNSDRYTSWFTDVSHILPYQEFKAQLQLLQLQSPCAPDRWLLKSPHHLWGIEALLKVFPDAMIVQTHRDPAKVVPSCCSLAQTTRGIASSSLDPAIIGRQMIDQLAVGLERTRALRPHIPQDQIIDVHFQDIVADPMGVAALIHDTFGLDFGAAEAGIASRLAAEVQGRHGDHDYTLEQFGLTLADIEDKFGNYCETFNVVRES
jgi:hypothetical protein